MGDTLNQLGIHWPKLLAQTINFGIILPIAGALGVSRQAVHQKYNRRR